MDIYQAIKGRRSVRQYTPQGLTLELTMKVLEAATWAPSGRNQQPWKFYLVQGENIAAIGEALGRVLEADLPPDAQRDEKVTARIKFHRTFGGAPLLVVATMPRDERSKVHAQGLGAAMQNLCLAAYAEGLGTCWMVQPLLVDQTIREVASIPATEEIFAVTPLGYPSVLPPAIPRRDPELRHTVIWVQ